MREFNRTQKIAMSSVLAAVYAVVTIFAPIPQYQAVQLRFADCLEVLAFFIGWPGVIGLSLGCFVANVLSPYGLLDMVLGTFSTMVSTITVMYVGKHSSMKNFEGNLLISMGASSIIMGVMIGWLLSFYGEIFGIAATAVTLSQIVAKVVIGYPIGLSLPKFMPGIFHVKGPETGKRRIE